MTNDGHLVELSHEEFQKIQEDLLLEEIPFLNQYSTKRSEMLCENRAEYVCLVKATSIYMAEIYAEKVILIKNVLSASKVVDETGEKVISITWIRDDGQIANSYFGIDHDVALMRSHYIESLISNNKEI